MRPRILSSLFWALALTGADSPAPVPPTAADWLTSGNAKEAKGDDDGALADFTKAIESDPKLARAYADRGLTRQQRGDLNGAFADDTKAIELDPKLVIWPTTIAGNGEGMIWVTTTGRWRILPRRSNWIPKMAWPTTIAAPIGM